MFDIIVIFGIFALLAILLFIFLSIYLKKHPKSAMYIEIFGYCILVISLLWSVMANLIAEFSLDSNFFDIDEKLNTLWRWEGSKVYYRNHEDIYESYLNKDDYWNSDIFNHEFLKKQDSTAKIISYGLVTLSSVFILSGRLSELINNRGNTNLKVEDKKITINIKKSEVLKQTEEILEKRLDNTSLSTVAVVSNFYQSVPSGALFILWWYLFLIAKIRTFVL